MRYYLCSQDTEMSFELLQTCNQFTLINNDDQQELKASVRRIGEQFFYSLDGRKWLKLRNIKDAKSFVWKNQIFTVHEGFKPSSLFQDLSGGLVTQIPGKVIKLDCKVGDNVKAGQTLLILEAMKMENEIKVQVDGVISAIYIEEGQSLESGTLMVELDS